MFSVLSMNLPQQQLLGCLLDKKSQGEKNCSLVPYSRFVGGTFDVSVLTIDEFLNNKY